MLITVGPLSAAGMPLMRVPNGFIGKRIRNTERTFAPSGGAANLHRIRDTDLVSSAVAIARPCGLVPAGLERAPDRPLQRTAIQSLACQQASGSGLPFHVATS